MTAAHQLLDMHAFLLCVIALHHIFCADICARTVVRHTVRSSTACCIRALLHSLLHTWVQVQTYPGRQCLLWSATWPAAVHSLASDLQRNAVKIVIAGAGLKANHNITQRFAVIGDDSDKGAALEAILEQDFDGDRILVFCGTKKTCDKLTRRLRVAGWPALAIHGDKGQIEREWVLRVRCQRSAIPDLIRCQCGKSVHDATQVIHMVLFV